MKLIDRHLLKEYLQPVAYCLTTFIMVFVIVDLFDNLSHFMEARTPLLLIARYYFCLVMPTLEFLVPASLLLATLYTLWQITRNSELIAMRASGISLYRVMLPFLAVGMCFSIATAAIKEFVEPEAGMWASKFSERRFDAAIQLGASTEAFYNNVSERRIWKIDGFNIDSPDHLSGVTVTLERDDGTKSEEITAGTAWWLDGEWWFFDGYAQKFHPNESRNGTPVHFSPFGREMVILSETPRDFVREMTPWEYLSSIEMARYLNRWPDVDSHGEKTVDLHRRIAMPWSCLIVILFGIPAGARSGRQSAFNGILLAVSFFFAFYAIMQVGLFLGKRELLWAWAAAWTSNIVFFTAGTGMIIKLR